MDTPVIEMRGVSFSFNGEAVLEDVSLALPALDFTALIGPNGSGKTTLLKILLGLLTPDRGTVRILGETPRTVSHRMGYVPQEVDVNLRFPVSVLDVVRMGLVGGRGRGAGFSRADREKARKALDMLDMGNLRHRRIGELSGGQRQRAFIARALVTDPEILLLDEPTASIDARGQVELYRLLGHLNRKITILLVSHDLLMISTHVKSVACLNRRLHYHDQAEITGEMLETMYPCADDEVCPVELIAHGLPHRVLQDHGEGGK
jgi:zinc transport system ATP-binding protein